MQNYKIDVLTLVENNFVKSDCADITFINNGTSNVTINAALTLSSQQSLTLTANMGEIDRTIYNFVFTGVGNNRLTVFRKIYI